MQDMQINNGFQELSTEEAESVEGGFIFNSVLNTTSDIFGRVTRAIADINPDRRQSAERVNNSANTILGAISNIGGLFGLGVLGNFRPHDRS